MRLIKYVITGLSVSLTLASGVHAVSWDVANEPQFFLDSTITGSQTTNIKLSAPFLNGEEVNMITTSGGVLRFRQGVKREDVYYSSATVNASTKVVTLSGVIRDVCRGVTRAIQGCGQGQQFNKGAIVELSVDARLLNLKGNVDRPNQWAASGALGTKLDGSGVLVLPKYTNTTTRLTQLGAKPVNGTVACVITDGLCYYRLGDAWISFGSGAQVNASATIAGKAQAATLAQLQILSSTGSTGALNFMTPGLFIKNGSGATSANRPVLTGSNGAISVTVGGTGRTSHATGALLLGQGALGITGIVGTAANQVPIWDGTRWAAGTSPNDVDVLTGSIANSNLLVNPLVATYFTQTGSLSVANINTKGKMFQAIVALDNVGWGAGAVTVSLKAGSQVIGDCTLTPTADAQAMTVVFYGTIRTVGASGVVEVSSMGTMGSGANDQSCAQQTSTSSFNTTTSKTLNAGVHFGTTNGANNATMTQFSVWSLTP